MRKTDQKTSAGNRGPDQSLPDLEKGIMVVRSHLRTLDGSPGVYRMLDGSDNVLYVGKAKNLKKRVVSYTRATGHTIRIAKMISLTRSMIFITTHTEAEALLLEANLIKTLKPRYNVLLRDDRSFPYIFLRHHPPWPQITKHRGARKKDGEYFGPFASAAAVNRTLNTLQRVFLLRSCSDSVLKNRTRPCLLFQIKRCSAPCVDRISIEDYSELVNDTTSFLRGIETGIQKKLAGAMQKASDDREYESAAAIRDRLRALTQVQAHQNVTAKNLGDADVIAAWKDAGRTCIQVFFYRAGQNWGNRPYFPRHEKDESLENIMGAFISQFYDNKPAPRTILTNVVPTSKGLIEEALGVRANHRIKISKPQRGERKKLMNDAIRNAKEALARHLAEKSSQRRLLEALATLFALDQAPQRIEVYDNSHISGTNALGAMIVAGPDGFSKNAYRKFNIKNKDISPGDDFAMMREVLGRRFSRLLKESPAREASGWPDLLLIDGGKGQLSAVLGVMEELGVDDVPVVAISKGPDRNAGRERFHMPGGKSFTLDDGHPVLYYLQRLRDEAHRFAIGAHRQRRAKTFHKSALDGISGIGPKRKKALLHHFGSAKAVENAGLKDLEAVDGVSTAVAETIYNYFHENA
jgi:excinuclease ABC subunit C